MSSWQVGYNYGKSGEVGHQRPENILPGTDLGRDDEEVEGLPPPLSSMGSIGFLAGDGEEGEEEELELEARLEPVFKVLRTTLMSGPASGVASALEDVASVMFFLIVSISCISDLSLTSRRACLFLSPWRDFCSAFRSPSPAAAAAEPPPPLRPLPGLD